MPQDPKLDQAAEEAAKLAAEQAAEEAAKLAAEQAAEEAAKLAAEEAAAKLAADAKGPKPAPKKKLKGKHSFRTTGGGVMVHPFTAFAFDSSGSKPVEADDWINMQVDAGKLAITEDE